MRFYVPEGVERFTITTRAADPEMRLEITPPDGDTEVREIETRKEQVHSVGVPAGADGTLWTLLVARGDRDLYRTMPLYFGEGIPGFIACAQ
jgi:hypothetical protein